MVEVASCCGDGGLTVDMHHKTGLGVDARLVPVQVLIRFMFLRC